MLEIENLLIENDSMMSNRHTSSSEAKNGTENQAYIDYERQSNNNNNETSTQQLGQTVITAKYLEETYSYDKLKSDNALKSAKNYIKKYYKPSPNCMKDYFFKRFPFFDWIRSYNVKQDLVKDLVAGLTIGIVHIPQGLAYALMAGVPAINGLYVTFFTVMLYVLLGTSKHLSTGTYAIISLMVASSIQKYKGVLYPMEDVSSLANTTTIGPHGRSGVGGGGHDSTYSTASKFLSDDPVEAKVLIAMSLALISGIIQIIFGILHVGFVTKYLSDAIVNGFTIGAAMHVVISQIPTLLGIKLGEAHIPFVIIGEIIEICKNIPNTKIATLIISLVAMIFLYIIKVHVNEKYKAKLPIPIPVELIVVVVGTVVSYFVKFNETYGVKIIGALPLGMPTPRVPPVQAFSMLFGDSVAIAIVTFALNISMAKLFAKKYNYEIRPNQELFAYGIGNLVVSFFNGFPACVGLSRCVILDGVGGKTQIFGIFSSILVLIVILLLAPLFKTLPNACLAAIIVVALKSLVLEVRFFPALFRRSKMEGMGWLATFLGVMILDLDVGLYIGVAVSLLLIIFKSQRARSTILGNIPATTIFEGIDVCKDAKEFNSIKIIRYEESIYYANVDNFKYKIIKQVNINPAQIMAKINKEFTNEKKKIGQLYDLRKKFIKSNEEGNKTQNAESTNTIEEFDVEKAQNKIYQEIKLKLTKDFDIKHIIIDLSCVNYIDSQGVTSILQLYESYKELGIFLHLSHCKQTIINSFKKMSFQEKFDFDFIFPTTFDAVRHILKEYDPLRNSSDAENSGKATVHHSIVFPPSAYKEKTLPDGTIVAWF